jgi:hypothetical protein
MIAGLVSEVQKEQLVKDGYVPLGDSAMVSDRMVVKQLTTKVTFTMIFNVVDLFILEKPVSFNQRTGREMRTFGKHDKLHCTSSINDMSGSFFYMAYPHCESTVQVSDVVCRGHF